MSPHRSCGVASGPPVVSAVANAGTLWVDLVPTPTDPFGGEKAPWNNGYNQNK